MRGQASYGSKYMCLLSVLKKYFRLQIPRLYDTSKCWINAQCVTCHTAWRSVPCGHKTTHRSKQETDPQVSERQFKKPRYVNTEINNNTGRKLESQSEIVPLKTR